MDGIHIGFEGRHDRRTVYQDTVAQNTAGNAGGE